MHRLAIDGGIRFAIPPYAEVASWHLCHKSEYTRVTDAITILGADPRPTVFRKLTGRPAWRIHIGSHRVIYEIDDTNQKVTVRFS